MKTTIDIPDGELLDVLRFTAAKTKREAIVTAIEDLIGVSAWGAHLESADSDSTLLMGVPGGIG